MAKNLTGVIVGFHYFIHDTQEYEIAVYFRKEKFNFLFLKNKKLFLTLG